MSELIAIRLLQSGYSLKPTTSNLFLADNGSYAPRKSFSLSFDGFNTQTWGGTTFIVAAAIGGDMVARDFGTAESWGGTRTTSEFV